MVAETPPRRFELGQRYPRYQLGPAGTTVVRHALPYGRGKVFRSSTPCCDAESRIDAGDATYKLADGTVPGAAKACGGCGWRWRVFLALGDARLDPVPPGAAHPQIRADRAEWVSAGYGLRPAPSRKRRRR